ncbi:type II toxin-antitoxin system VapC family toxin [soil metagenome]|nr:type II toxin-antitoxin system VapC family toxin [Deinococcota bacterium]
MSYLLDTHTFIWWDIAPKTLSKNVLALIKDPSQRVFLSMASVWEMQIKAQLGKLHFRTSLPQVIASQQQNGLEVLPIRLEHIFSLQQLPLLHKDPFDRLLIVQAQMEGLTLLSKDTAFADYDVAVVW